MRRNILKIATILTVSCLSFGSIGCATKANSFADQLNPFSDEGSDLGVRNTDAISGGAGGKKAEEARHALEVMSTYRRAQAPEPYYPVVRPAEIRLMWIPDHLNRLGDLVPAHYYYLRVLGESFEVQDAFENEQVLGGKVGIGNYGARVSASSGGAAPSGDLGAGGSGSATPWQYQDKK